MSEFKPKPHSKAIGERTEAFLVAKLLEAGYNVLIPYGDSQRYDLVIEDVDGQFWRIQCKTGHIANDGSTIDFNTASNHYHYIGGKDHMYRRSYHGQIDYFAVYVPQIGRAYLIPVDHAGKTHMILRLAATKNNQQRHIKMAEDYEL